MCSVLIFNRNTNTSLKIQEQTGQPERGDVVDVNDNDNFFWGNAPTTMDWWRIVIVPNATVQDILQLTLSNHDLTELQSVAWRYRVWSINLDTLAANQLPDVPGSPLPTWVVSLPDLLAAASMKPDAEVQDLRGASLSLVG